MNLKIEIITGEGCSFDIEDISDNKTGYTEEEQYIKNRFKYLDTVSIIALGILKEFSDNVEYSVTYMQHVDNIKKLTIYTNFDGRFKINYIVLPTYTWVMNNKLHLADYQIVYYIDNNLIYKYIDGHSQEVTIEEVIEVNPINTTISKVTEECVSICYLKKCFIETCKKIFEDTIFTECKVLNKVDENLIYKRDLLWMFINTISYFTEFNQLDEAQRLIELVFNCNGICKLGHRETDSNGCGCS